MTKPKAKTLIPARPDLDALRKRRRYRGKEILIGGQVHRIEFKSELRRLGKKAIAGARTISMGEIEITVEERNGLIAWIEYLESHIDNKHLASPPLTKLQQRMVKIEVQAWADFGPPNDGRSKKRVYQLWAAIEKLLPKNLAVQERTLNRWRSQPNYYEAFVKGCADAINTALESPFAHPEIDEFRRRRAIMDKQMKRSARK